MSRSSVGSELPRKKTTVFESQAYELLVEPKYLCTVLPIGGHHSDNLLEETTTLRARSLAETYRGTRPYHPLRLRLSRNVAAYHMWYLKMLWYSWRSLKYRNQ